MNDGFKAVITVTASGHVSGCVIDPDTNEEFILLHIETQKGSFVEKVRESYVSILWEIADKCFKSEPFLIDQSNRIAERIEKNTMKNQIILL